MATVYVQKNVKKRFCIETLHNKCVRPCQFKEEVNKVQPQNIKPNFTFPDVERIICTMVSEGGAGAD